MSIKKAGFTLSLCWRRQWESNTALYRSGKQARAVDAGFILSTPECALTFDTAPDRIRVESISCLGWTERPEPCRAAQREDKGQSRHLWLSGRELRTKLLHIA